MVNACETRLNGSEFLTSERRRLYPRWSRAPSGVPEPQAPLISEDQYWIRAAELRLAAAGPQLATSDQLPLSTLTKKIRHSSTHRTIG
jgi:hypothetical protein